MTIPWTPDDDEARRLLNERIDSFDIDHAQATLWERLLNWLNEALRLNIDPTGAGSLFLQVLLIIAVGVVGYLLFRYFRPSKTTPDVADQLADPTLTAEQYLATAQRQLAAGQLDEAYLAAYRSMVRSAAVREIVEVTPATTATLFGWSLGAVLPDYRDQLEQASTEFNRIIYGGNTPSREATDHVVALAQTVATATPQQAPAHTDPARLIPR